MGQAAALIAPPLRLSVALDRFGMFQPVALLVLGMAGTPLLLAVQAHLSVQRVGLLLATVVLAPAPALARRLAADALIRTITGGDERFPAVGTDLLVVGFHRAANCAPQNARIGSREAASI